MSDEKTITIEVDGRTLEARPGQMLIEVTDASGIPVPRFCYHKHLSIAANCRMCLVEVEKAPKPLPACATPVTDGMKVFTRSPLARAAQKGTMEFLLINHPLDCPICDQGGECELQDVAMGYGGDVSRFVERKRVVPDPDIGSLVSTDMTRCIHCTRCVRFGEEVAGLRELGATGRGEHTKIGTYVKHAMTSELSGNVIDLCPVGALTSKPFRFKARAWEMTQQASVAPHDSVGSNLYVHKRRNELMRVVPRENDAVNETWLSDRDRYAYTGLASDDRLLQPVVKEGGKWREMSWQDALLHAAKGLKAVAHKDPSALGTLISPKATLEELYLAQKLARGLGSQNVDHRLRTGDFRATEADPRVPWLGQPIAGLESCDAVLLVGTNVRKEQPLINHRLRKAALAGGRVMAINPVGFAFNYELAEAITAAPSRLVDELAAVAKAAGAAHPLADIASPGDAHRNIAEQLRSGAKATVLLGNIAVSHPDYTLLRGLAAAIAGATGANLGIIPEAANSVGAWLAGAVPHRLPGAEPVSEQGMAVDAMLADPRKAYLIVDMEPDLDVVDATAMSKALQSAGFVVALTAHRTPALEAAADVLLPMAAFGETSGTFVNAQGDRQSFAGVVAPPGEARPGWKVLRVLGNLMDLDGFDFESSEDVRDELYAKCLPDLPAMDLGTARGDRRMSAAGMERIGIVAPYAIDALCRRAQPLQRTADGRSSLRMSAGTAAAAGIGEGDEAALVQGSGRLVMKVTLDPGVPDGCVWFPAGTPGSDALGGLFGEVKLEKA